VTRDTMPPSKLKQLLTDSLDARDLTIEELVAQAGDLLNRVAPVQTRYKVTERPDVRTIRYYITQKLLPKPTGYEGGKARYAGPHLVRLLAIKKLQAEHRTLRQIANLLEQATDDQVLGLVLEGVVDQADSDVASRRPPLRSVPMEPVQLAAAAPARVQPAQERPGMTGSTLQRIMFQSGANLDLPGCLLSDVAKRRKLAAELEALAKQLRHGQGIEPDGDNEEDKGEEP
jgi:DNA-binding transcriptional MerR regulator